jgi:hypothetical protein
VVSAFQTSRTKIVYWSSASCMLQAPSILLSILNFWLQIQRSRVRFPALPDFLRSKGSGRGSAQLREDN